MTFAQPQWFLLLIGVVAMAGAGWWLARWQVRARRAFAGPQSSRWQAAPLWPKLTLVLLAATLLVVAAARPQWGSRDQRSERRGIDLVIVLDVSQSMQATDVAPSRFGVAQDELTKLVSAMRGGRFGLVFFAGSSVLRSPLSTDVQAISDIIKRADKETGLTRAGSDLGMGIAEAGRILEKSDATGKAVLLVSDGEDFGSGFREQAAALQQKGIVVYSAGTGTPAGTGLFDIDPRNRQPRPKLDAQGRPVVTKLNEGNLDALAKAGGGRYLRLDGTQHLVSLRDDLSRLQQTPLGSQNETLPVERFQIFVALAMLILVAVWLLPSRVVLPSLVSLRRLRVRPGVAVIALLALTLGACGGSGSNDTLRVDIAAANGLYEAGEFDKALIAYQRLLASRPDVPELSYNAGNTLNRLGRYDRAVVETQRGLPPDNAQLGAMMYYALGNHLVAQQQYEQAFDAYKNSLLLKPDDQDAKWNLELVLAQLRKQKPNDQSGQGQGQTPQSQGNEGPSQQGQSQGQPQPQQQQGEPGQPQPGQGQQPGQPSDAQSQQQAAEAQRTLQEALKGLDKELSFEDAIKILDLLRRTQETQQARPSSPSTPSGPDY